MTELGWDMLVDRIANRTVEPPAGMTLNELQHWMLGNTQCTVDILSIIDEMRDGGHTAKTAPNRKVPADTKPCIPGGCWNRRQDALTG